MLENDARTLAIPALAAMALAALALGACRKSESLESGRKASGTTSADGHPGATDGHPVSSDAGSGAASDAPTDLTATGSDAAEVDAGAPDERDASVVIVHPDAGGSLCAVS